MRPINGYAIVTRSSAVGCRLSREALLPRDGDGTCWRRCTPYARSGMCPPSAGLIMTEHHEVRSLRQPGQQ